MRARRFGTFVRRHFEALEGCRLLAAAPVAVDDKYTVLAGEMLVPEPGVLANDYDADGDAFSPVLVGAPLHGAVTLGPDGGFEYRPDRGFSGVDSFLYRARAADGESAPATVSITVKQAMSPVIWSAASGGNGHAYALVSVGGEWTAARDFASSIVYAGAPGHLTTLGSAAEWNWLNGRFSFNNAYLGGYQDSTAPDYSEPAGGWRWVTGEPWQFTAWGGGEPNNWGDGEEYLETMGATWNDIGARFPRGALQVEFEDVKNSAADDMHQLAVDAPRAFALADLLRNDVLVDATNARLSQVGSAAHGTVQLAPDGSIVYTPQAGFTGRDWFTYRVASDSGESNPATFWLKVGLDEFPAEAQGESYLTEEDTPFLSIRDRDSSLLLNDHDRDTTALSVEITSPPPHGVLELFVDGTFRYSPAQDFFGRDTFAYRVVDGPVASAPVTVEINILFVNDPPYARDDSYEVWGPALTVSPAEGVLANDVDPDFPLTAEVVEGPAHGSLEFAADGAFRYTPAASFKGIDRFTYRDFDYFLYTPATTVLLAVDVVLGDVNGDEVVNLNDFGALKANFGQKGATLVQGDLDGDADVDLADFGLLKENFGRTSVAAEVVSAGALAIAPQATAAVDVRDLGWLRWAWDQRNGKPQGEGER